MAMLPSLAHIEDLEARIGHPIADADERARAQALLNDASSLVRWETGKDYVDPETGLLVPIPDLIVTITCSAALRGWYNPAGVEATQLGAVSVRYGGAWLTESERNRLNALNGSGGLVNVELKPGFGWDGAVVGYVPVDNQEGLSTPQADWFPLGT